MTEYVLVHLHAQVANLLKEEIPQLYAMCGRGAQSTLRVLRPGLAATEIAVSPLPGNPTAVWTLKRSISDAFDAYIIVSFTNATLVSPSPTPYTGWPTASLLEAALQLSSLFQSAMIISSMLMKH